jgi:hypothetical protein
VPQQATSWPLLFLQGVKPPEQVQTPFTQEALVGQTLHVPRAGPQALAVLPAWQAPVLSQQPLTQGFVALQGATQLPDWSASAGPRPSASAAIQAAVPVKPWLQTPLLQHGHAAVPARTQVPFRQQSPSCVQGTQMFESQCVQEGQVETHTP